MLRLAVLYLFNHLSSHISALPYYYPQLTTLLSYPISTLPSTALWSTLQYVTHRYTLSLHLLLFALPSTLPSAMCCLLYFLNQCLCYDLFYPIFRPLYYPQVPTPASIQMSTLFQQSDWRGETVKLADFVDTCHRIPNDWCSLCWSLDCLVKTCIFTDIWYIAQRGEKLNSLTLDIRWHARWQRAWPPDPVSRLLW